MSAAHSRKVKRWTDFDPALVDCLRSGKIHQFDSVKVANSFRQRMKLLGAAIKRDETAPDDLREAAFRVAWAAPQEDYGKWIVGGYLKKPGNVPLDEVIRQLHANAVSTEAK